MIQVLGKRGTETWKGAVACAADLRQVEQPQFQVLAKTCPCSDAAFAIASNNNSNFTNTRTELTPEHAVLEAVQSSAR